MEKSTSELLRQLDGSRGRRPFGDLRAPALVVIDAQRLFTDPQSPASLPAWPAIAPVVRALVAAFQAAGRPVIFTRHAHPPGDDGALIGRFFGRLQQETDPYSALAPGLTDGFVAPVVLTKARHSVFAADGLLAALGASDSVVLAGVQTHLCVLASAMEAAPRGLVPVVVADATASRSDADHEAALRVLAGGHAHVATGAEVLAALESRTNTPDDEGAQHDADLLVVGAGPAGLTCAFQAVRDGLRVCVVGDEPPGGLLRAARRIDNYPGRVPGVAGTTFCDDLVRQVRAAEVSLRNDRVVDLRRGAAGFVAELESGGALRTSAVVLATGTTPAPWTVEGADELVAAGRLHRDVRTLSGLRAGERVLVLGGGEAAADAALWAVDRGAQVWLGARGTRLRLSPGLRRELEASPVELRFGAEATRLVREGAGLRVIWAAPTDAPNRFEHVLVCIGRLARRALLRHVWPDGPGAGVETPVGGLFLAGDMLRGRHRYLASACGDGQRAAIAAAAWLRRRERVEREADGPSR